MENVKVIEIGKGEVVSNYGTYEGVPALYIEPVEAAGKVGTYAPETPRNAVAPGGTILRFHSKEGALVLMEDILSALNRGGNEDVNRNLPKNA